MHASLRISARRAALAAGSKLRSVPQNATQHQTGVAATFATVPGPRLFDYETVKSALQESDAVEAIEAAFGMLARGKVDVPIPMHIGIDESDKAGPGDCHIKGGYIFGTTTWTVKLANVSFYKNVEKVRPPTVVACSLLQLSRDGCAGACLSCGGRVGFFPCVSEVRLSTSTHCCRHNKPFDETRIKTRPKTESFSSFDAYLALLNNCIVLRIIKSW